MVLIYVLLGLILGLLASILTILTAFYFRPQLERTLKQTVSRVRQKGALLEPDDSDLTEWLDNMKTE